MDAGRPGGVYQVIVEPGIGQFREFKSPLGECIQAGSAKKPIIRQSGISFERQ